MGMETSGEPAAPAASRFGLRSPSGEEHAVQGPAVGFGVQFQGATLTAARIAAAPHGLLILEPSSAGPDYSASGREEFFSAAEIDRMRRGGERPVFAYLNIGEATDYRQFWVDALGRDRPMTAPVGLDAERPAWLGGLHDGRERLSAFWRPEWRALLAARIDQFLRLGYDGVMLDDVLHYYTWAALSDDIADFPDDPSRPEDLTGSARAMMALVLDLVDHARRRSPHARAGFGFICNGEPYLFWNARADRDADAAALYAEYVGALDGVLQESMLGERPELEMIGAYRRNYLRRGVPVLTIDFGSRNPGLGGEALRALTTRQAERYGFNPYVADDELFDRLYAPMR